MNPFRGRILVIRGGAIGDFILTLPAIAALRSQFPAASLEILGYPHIARLALAGGLVHHVHSIEARALARFFARNGELEQNWADYFSEFDLIISYLYDPDGIFQTNVSRCTAAQFIAGPHRPNEAEGVHATLAFLKPLERLAIFDANPIPSLGFVKPVLPLQQLALHPGSGSEKKNWPEKKWAELLEHLINHTSFKFLLVGGEAEGERLQRLGAALPPTRLRVAQSVPLPELASLLHECAGFVGHDSGISHLAAAVGLPGVVLWGPSTAEIWRPPSERVLLARDERGLEALPVPKVVEKLRQLLAEVGHLSEGVSASF